MENVAANFEHGLVGISPTESVASHNETQFIPEKTGYKRRAKGPFYVSNSSDSLD